MHAYILEQLGIFPHLRSFSFQCGEEIDEGINDPLFALVRLAIHELDQGIRDLLAS